MPCNSDHMNPSDLELNLSKALMLLDEMKTGTHVDPTSDGWRGYDERVYNKQPVKRLLDDIVMTLCIEIGNLHDVTERSLELQLWWREHQRADKVKKATRTAEARKLIVRSEALAKLTDEERDVLGI